METKDKIVVAVSGGFDPVHIGHVRMFEEAKKLGDELVVILNNDNWLKLKKGFAFMPQQERKEVIEAFRSVDRVVFTSHTAHTTDISICKDLEAIRPTIFAKGGDRTADNIPEYELCNKLGIQMVFNMGHGGKVQSSSWLTKRATELEVAQKIKSFVSEPVASVLAPGIQLISQLSSRTRTTILVLAALAVFIGAVDALSRFERSLDTSPSSFSMFAAPVQASSQ